VRFIKKCTLQCAFLKILAKCGGMIPARKHFPKNYERFNHHPYHFNYSASGSFAHLAL